MEAPNKKCRKCGHIKPMVKFCKNIMAKNGYTNTCLDCFNAYQRDRYAKRKAELSNGK